MADESDYFNISKISGLVKKGGFKPRLRSAEEMGEAVWTNDQTAFLDSSNVFLVDGSDALANDGLTIQFTHVPSDAKTSFKAFITAFNESYTSDWSEEPVYGRADPIRLFKQTSRNITLSFIAPAATEGEGFENLGRLQKLISFLYPSYTDPAEAQTISQSPLVRLKVMNLITNNVEGGNSFNTHMTEKGVSPLSREGLLGAITNVAVNHNLDNPDEGGVFHTGKGTIIPKLLEITIDFKVIHEQPLGWSEFDVIDDDQLQGFFDESFPYGADIRSSKPMSRTRLKELQNEEALAYTEAIVRQQEEERRNRSLQAAKDIAASELLKANGKLNRRGRRLKRRLDETSRDPEDRRAFTRGIRNSKKAAHYAAALATIDEGGGLKDSVTGADVESAANDAAAAADRLGQEKASWIK